MVRFAFAALLAGSSVLAATGAAGAAQPKDILVHANALVCKDPDSLTAAIAAWQAWDEEGFRAYQENGACFLTRTPAKGRLLEVSDDRAAITIEFFLLNGAVLNVDAGVQLYAMVGTYSAWPDNWTVR